MMIMNKDKKNAFKTENGIQQQEEQSKKQDVKKQMRGNILFTIGMVLVVALIAFGLWKLSGEDDNPANIEVFRTGDMVVYLDEMNLCMLQNTLSLGITKDHLDGTTAEDGTPVDKYYCQQIMEMIIDYKVGAMIAKQEGLSLSEKEEDAVRADALAYLTKMNGHALKELGINQDLLIEVYQQRYLAKKLEDQVTEEIEVAEQRYSTIYVMMFPIVQMNEDGSVAVAEDGVTPILLTEEEKKQRKEDADAAYQALKDGEDYATVAKKYNVDIYSGEQSNLVDNFEDPFLQYVQSLQEGECSPVIEAESFYGIVVMITENNEELAQQIMDYYRSDMEDEYLDTRRVEWYETLGLDKENIQQGNCEIFQELTLYKFVDAQE
jgi:hypothetical protein